MVWLEKKNGACLLSKINSGVPEESHWGNVFSLVCSWTVAGSEKINRVSVSLPPFLGEYLEMYPVNKMGFFSMQFVKSSYFFDICSWFPSQFSLFFVSTLAALFDSSQVGESHAA